MILTVFNVFKINQSIEKLIQQNTKFPFKDGYELLKFKRELDDIEQYTVDRLNNVIDNERMRNNQMTKEEEITYITIMNSEVNVNDLNIDFESLKNNAQIVMQLSDIEALSVFFEEKNNTSNE